MIIQEIENEILLNNQLNVGHLSQLLEIVSDRKIGFGELYFLSGEYESWRLEEKIIKSGSYHRDSGAGIRAITGEKTGFAYTDQIQFAQLEKSAIAARSITQAEGTLKVTPFLSKSIKPLYSPMNPLYSIEQEMKIALLSRVDEVARAEDKRIIEVNATLACSLEKVLVAATDGTLASDIRPLVRLSVNVIAEEDGKRETGSSGGGAREDCHIFFAVNPETGESFVDGYAKEAVRLAILSLSAKAAPAGTLPVILGAGWPAVLLHEAVGHGLEGDFNRKKTSLFSGKMGEKVTSELCTIIDNGHMARRRGSLTIDDEGTPTQKTVLIEKGILKNYLFDKLNAKLMGTHSTGNGRREHYSMLPMPRMTNTYMLSGQSTFDEIISSVDYGIYAPGFSGGQVDITSGKFVFSTSEAYLVESGKIKHPIKGATLIGSGIETMNEVSMVGDDMKLDPGVGVCGKAGQSVPVGVGQPTIKVNKLTVGGTS